MRITVPYTKMFLHLWQYLCEFFLIWDIFWSKDVEKIKTRLCSTTFFTKNRAVYEIMWKNIVEPDWSQKSI
jgi:hypothetical protein